MYMLDTEWYLDYSFFMEDYIAAFHENVCIYLEMKSKTLNFVRYLSVEFCIHLFLNNLGVLNANQSNNILFLMSLIFRDTLISISITLSSLEQLTYRYMLTRGLSSI